MEIPWFWCLSVELIPSQYRIEIERRKICYTSPLSDSSPRPDRLSLSWRCTANFIWSIPSQTQGLYVGVSHWVSGFGMLSGTRSLSLSTSQPCARSWLIFSRRVSFGVIQIFSSPSSGTSILLTFSIKGLLIGKYVVSGFSVTNFTHISIAYSYVTLKSPWHRKIHHWWTLFTLFSSVQTTLK